MKKHLLNPVILFSNVGQAGGKCGKYVIFIAVAKIDSARLTVAEWKQNNIDAGIDIDKYICEETKDEITVDLETMVNASVDAAQWLSTNSSYIDFDQMYSIVEEAHFLDPNDPIALGYINAAEEKINNSYFESKTLLELKEHYKIDIENPSYSSFIEVSNATNPSSTDEIKIAQITKYTTSSFTSALISAIVFKNLAQPVPLSEYSKCDFVFTIINNNNVIVKFTYKAQSSYYDYSQDTSRGLF